MCKIIFLCNNFSGGGGERVFSFLYDKYKDNPKYTFFSIKKNEIGGRKSLGLGVFSLFVFFLKVYQLKPKVVHSHIHLANVFNVLGSFVFNYKSQVVVHGFLSAYFKSPSFFRRCYGAFLIRIYKAADKVIVVSAGLSSELRKLGVLEPLVVYNTVGISSENYLRDDRDKNIKTFKLAVIGRLHEVKNIDCAIRAMEKVPNCELYIFGEGEEKKALVSLASSLNVSDRVFFLGYVDNIDTIYSTVDIVVSCSKSETFSLVLLESLIRGIPVISSSCPTGPEEILEIEKIEAGCSVSVRGRGMLFPVGNDEQLSMCIKNVMNFYSNYSPSTLDRKYLSDKYSPDRFFSSYESLLKSDCQQLN